MKQSFFILLILLISQLTFGQTIKGQVIDADTKIPLIGANISIDGTTLGVVTDSEGYFFIKTKEVPLIISASYVGYEVKTLTIVSFTQLKISLNKKINSLEELIITDQSVIEQVFPKPYSVKDYVFYNNQLVLLVYRNFFKKYSLILLGEDGEIISERSIKKLKPVRLFKGCLGGIHLISAVNTRQIYIENNEIRFLKSMPTLTFEARMNPCVAANPQFIFYKKTANLEQIVNYIAIRKIDPDDRKVVATIQDWEKLDMLEHEGSFQQLREAVKREHNAGQPAGSTFGANIGNADFVSRVIFKPIYSPLFEHNDTLFLFNHTYNLLLKKNLEGETIDSIAINYHFNKKWRKKILFDQETGNAYTLFDTKWNLMLHKINLETGELEDGLILERPFINTIKIRNGYLYFLYYAPQHGVNIRKLERMRLY